MNQEAKQDRTDLLKVVNLNHNRQFQQKSKADKQVLLFIEVGFKAVTMPNVELNIKMLQ